MVSARIPAATIGAIDEWARRNETTRSTGFDLPALTLITQLQRYAAHRAIVGGGRVTSEANRRRF